MKTNKEKYLYIKSLSDGLPRPLIFCTARVCACMGCVNNDLREIELSGPDYLIEKCRDVGMDLSEVVYLLRSGSLDLFKSKPPAGFCKKDYLLVEEDKVSLIIEEGVLQEFTIDSNFVHYLFYQIKLNPYG